MSGARPDFQQIPLSQIDEPELPSRTSMDDAMLDELVTSMRTIGFISVLVVVMCGDRFRVVAGHRRTIAARRAGLQIVPCLVYPSESDALDAIQFAENRYREELSASDEAIWFSELLERYPTEGTDGVAARVRESRAYVEGRINLLRGDPQVFASLSRGEITIGVAQQLNRVPSAQYRQMYLDLAIQNGATVGIVQGWVREYQQLHARATNDGAALDAPAPSPVAAPLNFFRCAVCDRENDPASMRPKQIHEWCLHNELVPALTMYRERHRYVLAPRSVDEAAALVSDLLEQFPSLAGESTPAEGRPA